MNTSKTKVPPPPAARQQAKTSAAPWGGITTTKQGIRIMFYGQGGMGKTLNSLYAPGNKLVMDFDNSLPLLRKTIGEELVSQIKVYTPTEWDDMISTLGKMEWFNDIDSIVIDTMTKAEELAQAWVVKNVKTIKGADVRSIEGFGYKEGYRYSYDKILEMLSLLDQHVSAGRNVVLVCHMENANAANAGGEDFLRAEPRLARVSTGNVREKLYEWCDFVLYMDEMKQVTDDGKAKGEGNRAIYTSMKPWFRAKRRGHMPDKLFPQLDDIQGTVWDYIIDAV